MATASVPPALPPRHSTPPKDLPPPSPAPAVTQLAKKNIPIPAATGSKKVINAKPFSFTHYFKKIWWDFTHVFDSDADTFSSSVAVAKAPPKLVVELRPQFNPLKLMPQKPKSTTSTPANAPAGINKSMYIPPKIDTREETIVKLQALATGLAAQIGGTTPTNAQKIHQTPLGQANLGNTCHFNSALQCIEACYLEHDENCKAMIGKNLALTGTLEQLEENAMHDWAPIKNANPGLVTQLKAEIAQLKTEINALGPDQFLLKRQKNEERSIKKHQKFDLKHINPMERKDKLLFKWSYLLLLQAKKYGTPMQVTEALKLHHHVTFAFVGGQEFAFENRFRQLDAQHYFVLFHEKLERQYYQTNYREAIKNQSIWSDGGANVEPKSFASICLTKESEANGKEVGTFANQSFKGNLDLYFHEKVRNTQLLADLNAQLVEKQHARAQSSVLNVLSNRQLDATITRLQREIRSAEGNVWGEGDNRVRDFEIYNQFTEAPPPMLFFHVGRFYQANLMAPTEKLSAKLPFGEGGSYTDQLDLSEYFKPTELGEDGARYELAAITEHGGSLSGGHYTSYVRKGDKWFHISDANVSPTTLEKIQSGSGYMYCYRRVT